MIDARKLDLFFFFVSNHNYSSTASDAHPVYLHFDESRTFETVYGGIIPEYNHYHLVMMIALELCATVFKLVLCLLIDRPENLRLGIPI